jgi:hypothetical protein
VEENEAEQVYEELRYTHHSKPSNKKGIVSICSFRLKPDSRYNSQFQPADIFAGNAEPSAQVETGPVHFPRESVCDLRRDQCPDVRKIYEAITAPARRPCKKTRELLHPTGGFGRCSIGKRASHNIAPAVNKI